MIQKGRIAFCGAAAVLATAFTAPANAQLNRTVSEAENATAAAAASQRRVDRIDDEIGDLFREFRATLQRIESQRLYVEQQKVFLKSQENEIEDLTRQIGEVEDVLRNLLPMQLEMIDELDQFIRLDLPFLLEERTDRVARLRELMDEPPTKVPPAEKYRKIVEAYEIETDYGRFLKHYEGPLFQDPQAAIADDAPLVDYLMIGRVAFIYMSKDESQIGLWNAATNSWDRLPGSYQADVRRGIRMAKEVTTPDVFFAPVPGSTSVGGEG